MAEHLFPENEDDSICSSTGGLKHFFLDATPEIPNPWLKQLVYNRVHSAYCQDHRAYHNLSHIEQFFGEFEKHCHLFGDEAPLVAMAIFYHDIVYNAEPGKDEMASIRQARQDLTILRFKPEQIDRICQLIDYTRTHDAPADDFTALLFLDMDMSILASDPKRYKKYVAGIKKEFKRYDPVHFLRGRNKFIGSMIGRIPLFKTPQYQGYDAIAKRNLHNERLENVRKMNEIYLRKKTMPQSPAKILRRAPSFSTT